MAFNVDRNLQNQINGLRDGTLKFYEINTDAIKIDTLDGILSASSGTVSAGGGAITYSGQADETILKGQPVYTKGTTHLGLAKAITPYNEVSGLAKSNYSSGVSCTYQFDETFSSTDWTNVTGSATLTTGTFYYLDPNNFGKLITTAPSTIGHYIVEVGKALDTQTLEITNRLSVLL